MSADKTIKIRKVRITESTNILNEQNQRCLYCGEKVDIKLERGKHWSLEHVLPVSLLKWLKHNNKENLDLELLWQLTCDNKNLGITHYKCNINKSSLILSDSEIDNLYTSEDRKKWYKDTIHSSKEYIEAYLKLKNKLYQKQLFTCGMCHRHKNIRYLDIRRKSWDFERTEENAVLLCSNCGARKNRKGIVL